ncbi:MULTISPECIES: hypothetical protein [unclassified Nocardiopsis]|uniref:hypothetical protein n=1 Tax=unclassified Nocardiopsis TaxID=2649073 RepID=UPI00135B43C2|nr:MULTISPECIES: hypothetical protein [unclassified Nocardiopsis]
MQNRTKQNSDMFSAAIAAFQNQRGLTFTVEWRRFPWTQGPDVERALVGPSYLGDVAIGLKDNWSWSYQDQHGTWKFVRRDRLELLIEAVIQDRAGSRPPLPSRSAHKKSSEPA